MAETGEIVERMSRAARTTLFEAACDPGLLFALVLSNLMSPALWALRSTIEDAQAALAAESGAAGGREADRQALLMTAIQRYVDGHFFHLAPLDVRDVWGLLKLDDERARLGARIVDDAIGVIVEEMNSRDAHGVAMDRIDVRPLIEQGTFPEYTYRTLDVLCAERRILKRKKHKPLGITCCADEAILICSLAAALHDMAVEDLMIFGSVGHYSAFLRGGRRSCWFNGKHEYFFEDTWRRQVGPGGSQDTFDARLGSFDRIVTVSGTYMLHHGTSTIAPARLEAIDNELAEFFGVELRQLREARAKGIRFQPDPLRDVSIGALDHIDDVADIAQALRKLAAEHPGTILEAALYAFRDLAVRHPEAYLRAALREHTARQAASAVHDVDDAVAIVRGIEGDASIFETPERISLPDEVLTLRTGSHRDKALLLYVLIQHAPGIAAADKDGAELLYTGGDSFVHLAGEYLNTRSFARSARIEQPVTLGLRANEGAPPFVAADQSGSSSS